MGYQNTPVEKDDFTRTMVELFDDKDLIGIPQGGQSFFGNPANGSKTVFSTDKNTVEIAILRGNDTIAVMVPRGGVPGIDLSNPRLTEQKQSVFQRVYPLIEDNYQIRAGQLLFAIPGESSESRVTREDRMQYLARAGTIEMQRRIGRLYEYLAWQSLLTGKMPAIYGTSDSALQYDFLRPSAHILDVTTAWDSGDPIDDLTTAVATVRQVAHVTADYCVMANDSWENLIVNDAIEARATNRRFNLVTLGPEAVIPAKYKRMIDNGFLPVGKMFINGADLMLFVYVDGYTNPSGTFTLYLPSGYAMVGWTGARADRYFGPPEVLPMGSAAKTDFQSLFGFSLDNPPEAPKTKPGNVFESAALHFDAYPEGTNKGWVIRAQSAPIFATTMTDAFYVMYGCA